MTMGIEVIFDNVKTDVLNAIWNIKFIFGTFRLVQRFSCGGSLAALVFSLQISRSTKRTSALPRASMLAS
jgi:hypothetical protein